MNKTVQTKEGFDSILLLIPLLCYFTAKGQENAQNMPT